MASDDKRVDEALEALADKERDLTDSERETIERMAGDVEQMSLQDRILRRYLGYGRDLLGDSSPQNLDPRLQAQLEPILGPVDHIRVHTGKLATEAARAMDARAFAIGDGDIFIDQSQFDMTSTGGRALLAHEVAHNKDAATGFAMSRRGGSSQSSDREAFAEGVADRYVQAEAQSQHGVPGDAKPAGKPKIDKQFLAKKIAEVFKKQDERARDRFGRRD